MLRKLSLLVILLTNFFCYSQMGIGISVPAKDAMLELKSMTKGFLPTRLTTQQRDALISPSIGLVIYNVTKNCLEWYNGSMWFNRCDSQFAAIVSSYSCSGAAAGTLSQGLAVWGVSQTITANVTTPGLYNISASANGVLFSGSGVFNGTGLQDVVLTASGTPISAGTNSFVLNTTPNCSFDRVTIVPKAVVSSYNCNGASVGSLFQGRAVTGVTQAITANVTSVGAYDISAISNGVTFSATGIFTSTGLQNVVLTAAGTPVTAGTNSFILNTSPNCSFDRITVVPEAVVSSYNCTVGTAGTLTQGQSVSGVTQTISANVTSPGTYNISTSANGVTFSASGTFTSTGLQNVVLTANGTPAAFGTNSFVLNTSPNCSFDRITNPGQSQVSSYSCTAGSAGVLIRGQVVSGVTQTITATVTKAGLYNIAATANGVTFSGSGTFTTTGVQNVMLTASGTPANTGTNSFVLNTTPNCSFDRVTTEPQAVVSSYSCAVSSVGTLTQGQTLSGGVTQTISATVTKAGTYNISAVANGVTFAASGTFTTTGVQNVVLTATGTPISVGTNSFVLNTTPNCSFDRATGYGPAVISDYNCTGPGAGTMTAGVPVSGVTHTIAVTVTSPGTYSIATNQTNGIIFSASGTFTTTGVQNVVLTAIGTPYNPGPYNFLMHTTPNCVFSRTTLPALATYTCAANSYFIWKPGTEMNVDYPTSNSSGYLSMAVTVKTSGTYDISVGPINGVTFSGSGQLTANSSTENKINLYPSGTPESDGTFQGQFSGTGCTAKFNVSFSYGPAELSIVSCNAASQGEMFVNRDVAETGASQTIRFNVIKRGYCLDGDLTTPSQNGVWFHLNDPGFFTKGNVDVVIPAMGVPLQAGVFNYSLHKENPSSITGDCSFTTTVKP